MDEGRDRATARREPAREAPVQPEDSPAERGPDQPAPIDGAAPESVVSVAGVDLDEVEQDDDVRRAAENVRRRAADRRLRDELARDDFSGPGYQLFAEELGAYGLAVCRAWLLTGEMFVQCARRGYRIGSKPHYWDEHDIEGLASLTVAQALQEFRSKGLRAGRWREDGGASLKTYFVTACVYAFLNAYRSWRHEQDRWGKELTFEPADVDLFDKAGHHDVASQALTKIEAAEARDDRSHYQQQLLTLRGLDYTHAEIAELVGRTTSAVERAFGRMRLSAERDCPGSKGASA